MKSIIFTALLISLQFLTYAQCDFEIPADHNKVTFDQSLELEEAHYWVCQGVELTITNSNGSTIYMEENSILNIDGHDGVLIKAQESCTINFNAGSNIGLTMEPSCDFNNNAGVFTLILSCDDVFFDTSLAGTCDATSSVSESNYQRTALYPNPSVYGMNISLGTSENVQAVITDISGKIMFNGNIYNGEVPTENLPSGYYILQYWSNKQLIKESFIIR